MTSTRITTSAIAGLILAAAVAGGATAAAAAIPDPGQPMPNDTAIGVDPNRCPLRRIDTQLVRCDYLTGGGVRAPAFISEL